MLVCVNQLAGINPLAKDFDLAAPFNWNYVGVPNTQALGQGFVDELGDLDTATEQALSLAGIPDADLIQYRQPLNLANLFQLFGKSEAKEIKIDLGVDLPKLKAGRLYFLSPLLLY